MNLEVTSLVLRYADLRVLDPGRVGRLVAALSREDQQTPVLVVGEQVLVDGYHRVAALKELGRDLVHAVKLDLSEPAALVFSWRLETGRRKLALEEGWLLEELSSAHGRSASDLATELRRPRSWVSQRLGLVRALPESVQNAIRTGAISADGAQKYLVPMARQDRTACERMVAALREPVTKRQVERLYLAWRKADPYGRARIVEQPGLLLKTEDLEGVVPLDEEERLAADFERIAGLCGRARRQVAEVFGRPNTMVRRAWTQACEAMAALNEEVIRAGSGHESSDPPPAARGARDADDRGGGRGVARRGEGRARVG